MGMFSYTAMDPDGKLIRGRLDAANIADLEMRLGHMDLDLIDYKAIAAKSFSLRRRPVKRQDLINFCFHMEQLTNSGVPLLDGLADLRDSLDHPDFRGVIADLIENIEGGQTFSEALGNHPTVFDKTFVSLIAAGEHSGQLPSVFKSLNESLKWQDELAAQTKKLMMYPLFVGTVIMAVVFFLMIYLVPQLVSFIKMMGKELPLHTRILIYVSDVFVKYWYILLSVPPLLWVGVKLLLHVSPEARFKADGYKLRVWMIGPILEKIILARFASFFALMYESGIAILDCIKLSEDIVNNLVIADALKRAGVLISEGKSVTASFENLGIFPPLVVRMMRVGEATGALDTALRNVSYFYNREVKEAIEKVQAMIEPIMTVVMGAILGWIMVSVLGPIYDTISKIKT